RWQKEMKACSYCGRENDDGALTCRECGTEFQSSPEKPPEESAPEFELVSVPPSSPLVDLSALPGAFSFEEGFSRPNWEIIYAAVEKTVNEKELDRAWNEIALQWVLQLRQDLGGEYFVMSSTHFLLLCALSREQADRMLSHVERALAVIE